MRWATNAVYIGIFILSCSERFEHMEIDENTMGKVKFIIQSNNTLYVEA